MTPPDWIPADAWAGYVEMRKKLRKPMTERAMTLRIKDLEQFRDEGHDVGAVLDQSTNNSWTDLYPPRGKERRGDERRTGGLPQLGKHGQATAANAQDWLETQEGQPDTLEAKRRFATLLTGLADYYKQDISRAVLGLYWEGLRQFDYNAVEKACWAHTQNPDSGMWMPKVADIVKMLAGRTDDQAKIAWAKVDRAVRTVGIYQDVAFDDGLIHRVIADMGGWVALNGKSEDEWPFVAKEFETRYRGFRMRGNMPEYPGHLVGMASSQNACAGIQHKADIMLIGERQAAIAVIKSGSKHSGPALGLVNAAELSSGAAPIPFLK